MISGLVHKKMIKKIKITHINNVNSETWFLSTVNNLNSLDFHCNNLSSCGTCPFRMRQWVLTSYLFSVSSSFSVISIDQLKVFFYRFSFWEPAFPSHVCKVSEMKQSRWPCTGHMCSLGFSLHSSLHSAVGDSAGWLLAACSGGSCSLPVFSKAVGVRTVIGLPQGWPVARMWV